MDTFTTALSTLTETCTRIAVTDLPAPVRQRATRVLTDNLGAMLAAEDEPEIRAADANALSRGRPGEASLIRSGLPRVACEDALWLNSMACCWCELDEGYRPVTCHAGLYVLPALLVEAERHALTLDEVLRCLVLGYEICTRLALCFRFLPPRVHAHALFSPVGAAAATLLARGAAADCLAHGIAGAATLASLGPRTHLARGYLTRNIWSATGAVAGWQAAGMTELGICAGLEAPEDVYGSILGGSGDVAAITDGLGTRWAILDGYHKVYACCQHGHSAVEAALACAVAPDFSPDKVAQIEVHTHPLALDLSNKAPQTILGAKFSVEHMVAAALVYRTGNQAAFSTSALNDPAVMALRSKVELSLISPFQDPRFDRPSRVIVRMFDGTALDETCLVSTGSPSRPLSDTVFTEKLRVLGGKSLPGLAALVDTDGAEMGAQDWPTVLSHLAQPV